MCFSFSARNVALTVAVVESDVGKYIGRLLEILGLCILVLRQVHRSAVELCEVTEVRIDNEDAPHVSCVNSCCKASQLIHIVYGQVNRLERDLV